MGNAGNRVVRASRRGRSGDGEYRRCPEFSGQLNTLPHRLRYGFGGIEVRSSIGLDQLRQIVSADFAEAPIITLDLAGPSAPEPDEIVFRWGGRYGLELGRLGAHWIMRASLGGAAVIDLERRAVRCFANRQDTAAWQDVLVRRILPRVAILFGAAAAHGTAIAGRGGAIVLVGDSGVGKSTLTAACAAPGLDILSDDIVVFPDGAVPMVAPTTTGVCLWPDAGAALAIDPKRCTALPGYDGKVRFASGHDRGTTPVALNGLVLLDRAERGSMPSLEPVRASEALIHLARRRIRFNPAAPRDAEAERSVARFGGIVRKTPCYRLALPNGFERLGAAVAALQDLLV